jgi:hypothetical protein
LIIANRLRNGEAPLRLHSLLKISVGVNARIASTF